MIASERVDCLSKVLSEVRLPTRQSEGMVCERNERKLIVADQKNDMESKGVEYWKEFLASQLDFRRASDDLVKLERKGRSSPKSASVGWSQAVTDLNPEPSDSCPSVSYKSMKQRMTPANTVLSTCSDTESVISLPDPVLPESKPSRRAPALYFSLVEKFLSGLFRSAFEKKSRKKRYCYRSVILYMQLNDITERSFNMKDLLGERGSKRSERGFNMMFVKEIHIMDGETGYGYDTLFADALDSQLSEVFVHDPYIRLKSQSANFVVFCEVLVASAPNLKKITLRTQDDPSTDHCVIFMNLRRSLFERGIDLLIVRSETIHDREIRFDNGWTYRIGRGLDYFQKRPYLSLGLSNYNLRRCLETIVCITKQM